MYNYYEAMKRDIGNYVADNDIDLSTYSAEELADELWDEDSVTGNGSYFYADNITCGHYLADNSELLAEALECFGGLEPETITKHLDCLYQYFDCTIRCYLLNGCVEDYYDECATETDI